MPSATIFGYDLANINWSLVSYTLLAIAVMVVGVFYSYSSDALARTILFAIGGSLVFYFFYLRWFGNPEPQPDFWPPTINSCPDYLTYTKVANAMGGTQVGGCVDYLGVALGDTPLEKANPSDNFTIGDGKTFRFTSADVNAATTAEAVTNICNACRTAGVTWEGVWDGDNCLALNRFITRKQVADDKGCPV